MPIAERKIFQEARDKMYREAPLEAFLKGVRAMLPAVLVSGEFKTTPEEQTRKVEAVLRRKPRPWRSHQKFWRRAAAQSREGRRGYVSRPYTSS
jgi:hypothetical protein